MRNGKSTGSVSRWTLTWILALLLETGFDSAITRTPVLWGEVPSENTLSPALAQIAQTYKVARKLFHAPGRDAQFHVTLLGDSGIWFAGHPAYVEAAIHRREPQLDVRVDNLGVFGALIGDLEVISRHLDRLAPSLVIVTLHPSTLVPGRSGEFGNIPSHLLDTGWCDGPFPPATWTERLDRWGRTVWPLYRFREFARGAIEERVFPAAEARPPLPDHFASSHAFFEYMHEANSAQIEAAYEAWRRQPTFEMFIEYLRVAHSGFVGGVVGVPRAGVELRAGSPALAILDRLLARLAAAPWDSLILLMPENPLLDADTSGQYHQPAIAERGVALIRSAAESHGVRVVDARRWMPAGAFLDLVHLFPDISGFQEPLAKEIIDVLRRRVDTDAHGGRAARAALRAGDHDPGAVRAGGEACLHLSGLLSAAQHR